MMGWIFQDWEANRGNGRGRFVLVMFRLAQVCYGLPEPVRWLGWPLLAAYHLLVGWLLGIEIPASVRAGPGLRLYHGVGLVVHRSVVLGRNCTLRHGTTLGNRRGDKDAPVLGDGVDVGAQAILLGAIRIGDGARIGAGAVVLQDVPAGCTAVGNPARILTARESRPSEEK